MEWVDDVQVKEIRVYKLRVGGGGVSGRRVDLYSEGDGCTSGRRVDIGIRRYVYK